MSEDAKDELKVIGAIILVVLIFCIALAFRDLFISPWDQQARRSGAYTTVLASDGCYYRDYSSGDRIYRYVEIMPDNTENCPHRSKP